MTNVKRYSKKPKRDEEAEGLIFDIDRFATHDGPGIRMTIYLKGCDLNCPWCHNPESKHAGPEIAYYEKKCIGCLTCLSHCREGAISHDPNAKGIRIDRSRCNACGLCAAECYAEALKVLGQWMSVRELLQIALRDKVFFDCSGGGITLTGGELTVQAEFARQFLKACKGHGIHTAIETSGFSSWNRLKGIILETDLILYDLKLMDHQEHVHHIGAGNALVLGNLKKIKSSFPGKEICIRVPLIPGINDTEKNIAKTASFINKLGILRLELLPYNEAASAKYPWIGKDYPFPFWKTQSRDELERLKTISESYGVETKIVI